MFSFVHGVVSMGQDSIWMLGTWVVFLTYSCWLVEEGSVLLVLCAIESTLWLAPKDVQSDFMTLCCSFAFIRGQASLSSAISTAIAASAGLLSACVTATFVTALLYVSKDCRHTLLYSSSANELVC